MKYPILQIRDIAKPHSEVNYFTKKLIYVLALSSLLIIGPLTFIYWLEQRQLLAALCAVFTVVMSYNFFCFWKEIWKGIDYHIIDALIATIIIVAIHEIGVASTFWVFPFVTANALIHTLKKGIVINTVFGTASVIVVAPHADQREFIDLIASIIILLFIAHSIAYIIHSLQQNLMMKSISDPLTGLHNRRYLNDVYKRCLADTERNNVQYAALYIDIDHFKQINDKFGHSEGDKVLIAIAELIQKQTREIDHRFRVGGEEFMVIAKVDNQQNALELAEKLRLTLENTSILPNFGITTSIGVALLNKGESTDDWFKRADKALYAAKHQGRNQTVML